MATSTSFNSSSFMHRLMVSGRCANFMQPIILTVLRLEQQPIESGREGIEGQFSMARIVSSVQ